MLLGGEKTGGRRNVTKNCRLVEKNCTKTFTGGNPKVCSLSGQRASEKKMVKPIPQKATKIPFARNRRVGGENEGTQKIMASNGSMTSWGGSQKEEKTSRGEWLRRGS